MSIEDPLKWYKHVSNLQRYINSTATRSTHHSPFELLIGVPMKRREDLELTRYVEEELREHFEESRNKMREAAKKQIEAIQQENKRT